MTTNNTYKLGPCLACAVLALTCSLPAQAQFGGGMGGGGMGGGRRGTRSPEAAASHDAAAARAVPASEALYDLRMRLVITPEQSAAWEGFHHAYIGWVALAAGAGSAAEPAGGALQSMQQQLTLTQNRFAATEDLAQALKAMVASLTEAQRQVADNLVPRLLGLVSPSGERVTAR